MSGEVFGSHVGVLRVGRRAETFFAILAVVGLAIVLFSIGGISKPHRALLGRWRMLSRTAADGSAAEPPLPRTKSLWLLVSTSDLWRDEPGRRLAHMRYKVLQSDSGAFSLELQSRTPGGNLSHSRVEFSSDRRTITERVRSGEAGPFREVIIWRKVDDQREPLRRSDQPAPGAIGAPGA